MFVAGRLLAVSFIDCYYYYYYCLFVFVIIIIFINNIVVATVFETNYLYCCAYYTGENLFETVTEADDDITEHHIISHEDNLSTGVFLICYYLWTDLKHQNCSPKVFTVVMNGTALSAV